MPGFTSFIASTMRQKEVGAVLTDSLMLERTRIFRRLLVVRFGALTLTALAVAFLMPGLSIYARVVPVALFVTPPVWAWITERRLEVRLSNRLDGVGDQIAARIREDARHDRRASAQ